MRWCANAGLSLCVTVCAFGRCISSRSASSRRIFRHVPLFWPTVRRAPVPSRASFGHCALVPSRAITCLCVSVCGTPPLVAVFRHVRLLGRTGGVGVWVFVCGGSGGHTGRRRRRLWRRWLGDGGGDDGGGGGDGGACASCQRRTMHRWADRACRPSPLAHLHSSGGRY